MKNKRLFFVGILIVVIIFGPGSSNLYSQRKAAEVVHTISGDPVYKLLPPNAIPAIMNPEYVTGEEANSQMHAHEPVMGLVIDGQPMAYSTWQLDAHEIVNDVVGEVPIAVTW
jgi:hypothetical protein